VPQRFQPPNTDDPAFLAGLDNLDRGLLDRSPPPVPGASAASTPYEASAASTPYEIDHGLTENPFSLSTDPKFFYHSKSHDRVVQQLLTAIRLREGTIVVTGDRGIGKTILCRAVIEQLDRRTLASFVIDPFVSAEELLGSILADFGVLSRDELVRGWPARATRQELIGALRRFVGSLAALQAFGVVMIDAAQDLSADMLDHVRLLSSIDGDGPLLQVVLVGRPDLLVRLDRPELRQLAQRVVGRCELRSLAEDEIAGYVAHRLAVVGAGGRLGFDAVALARVYSLSGGIPRLVNLLCDRALRLGNESAASLINKALVDRAADGLDLTREEHRGMERPRGQIERRFDVMPRNNHVVPKNPGQSASRSLKVPLAVAGLMVLVLAGITAAGLVFHDRLSQIVARWESVPLLPEAPRPRVSLPIRPLPIPRETRGLPPPIH